MPRNPKSAIRNPQSVDTIEITTASVEGTQAFGARLGELLQPGDVVALNGPLGSGKTTLMQGIAQGLGVDPEKVKSPTFVLMREYQGRVPLIHLDGYRLEGAPQAAWLDQDLLWSPRKVTVAEWAQRFEGVLPPSAVTVTLEHVSANRRRLGLSSEDARFQSLRTQPTDEPVNQ